MKTLRAIKKHIKQKYPNALNIEQGSNGICLGVWFCKHEGATTRTFIPLTQY